MSSIQYNQPGSMISVEDMPQNLAPRSALSMEEMMAMISSSQYSNDAAAAAAAAAASRAWRQGSPDSNFTTATVSTTGGHRRNHE